MGSLARAHNDYDLRAQEREVHLLHLPQYSTICLRSIKRTRVSLRCNFTPTQTRTTRSHIPNESNPPSTPSRVHNELSRLTLWILVSKTHRLHYIYPRKIMQTPASHVPPHHHFQEEVPTI